MGLHMARPRGRTAVLSRGQRSRIDRVFGSHAIQNMRPALAWKLGVYMWVFRGLATFRLAPLVKVAFQSRPAAYPAVEDKVCFGLKTTTSRRAYHFCWRTKSLPAYFCWWRMSCWELQTLICLHLRGQACSSGCRFPAESGNSELPASTRALLDLFWWRIPVRE